jgi:hypothetical protein
MKLYICSRIVIFCFLISFFVASMGQSLVMIGNTNFPINDNTSSAPVAAINGGWQINGIGKIIKIVPHPSILTTLYACSASGGIFVSNNSAVSWTGLSGSFLPGVQFGCLAIDPLTPSVLYAGTGEPTYAQQYGWGGFGVFKSTNGGATWIQVNNTMGNVLVSDLVINPANTQEVVATTRNGIYKTTNGGSTWTQTLVAASQWIQQIARQGTGTNLVAIGNSRFYRSTDFGSNWTTTDLDPANSAIFANGRLAVAPGNSLVVYAGWVNNTFGTCNNACIFYSSDGGVSFTKKYDFTSSPKLISYDGVGTTGYGWANFFLTVSLTDPNTLFTGGHLLYKSSNNGTNWTSIFSNWWCCTHTDLHQLIYDPNNGNRLLNANDGGVFASTDLGVTWSPVSDGLYCNQYFTLGQGNLDPNFVIGGLQDNGIIYKNTDGNYHTYAGGDVYDHMTCDYTNNFNVYTSNTGGKVFNPYNRTQKANLNLPASVASSSRQSFFISPINPAIAYGWGTDVWRSSNINSYNLVAGTSLVAWNQISAFAVNVMDVKTSPADDNVLYALGDNATIYKSLNAAGASPSFASIALPGGTASNVYGSLTVSSLNPNVLYATANNKVLRSTNAGVTWTDYTATGLPALNYQKIYLDPYSTIESVYLVTALGLYYRDLTMTNWTAINPQASSPPSNTTANFAGNITGCNLYKGTGSSTSHVSFAAWGSGVWKTTFYNQQNNPLPNLLTNVDIGSPAIAGSASYDNNKSNFVVTGAGSGINASSTDQFNFTQTVINGNSDLVAKIYSVGETDPANGLSKTGLMFRTTGSNNAPYVMIALTGHAGAVFQYRINASDVATVSPVIPAPAPAYPYWLKLNKNAGNLISAYVSPDGSTWTLAGQVTVNLGANFLAGIANTSNNTALANKSAVSSLSMNSFAVIPVQNLELHAVLKDKNKVQLNWSFDSDDGRNKLYIERSSNATDFFNIFQKDITNTSGSIQTFNGTAMDASALSGYNYYRLKIVQRDGNIKFSAIDGIWIPNDWQVQVEPNPVKGNGELKVMISGSPAYARIKFELYDLAGRKVFTTMVPGNLAAGTYSYRVWGDNRSITGKLVVD